MTDEEKATLFPELSETGQNEAIALIEGFKSVVSKAANEAIGTLYTDVLPHIESDSWGNFQRAILHAVEGYGTEIERNSVDGQRIREAILRNHRAEIIADLNQDNLKRIEELEKDNAELRMHLNRALFGHNQEGRSDA